MGFVKAEFHGGRVAVLLHMMQGEKNCTCLHNRRGAVSY